MGWSGSTAMVLGPGQGNDDKRQTDRPDAGMRL
jgi:hypothetical protein